MPKKVYKVLLLLCGHAIVVYTQALAQGNVKVSVIAGGWANNSVNTVIFRKNSLVSLRDTQYAAFYDSAQYVVLAKRLTGSNNWQIQPTPYKGDATDAHKSISIMADDDGYLHMVWGQHNNQLNYARSVAPGALRLGAKQSMTGDKENRVSYPEFYKLPGNMLLFLFRDGGSGNGSLVLNQYNGNTRQWTRLQDNLIDGEGQRSAYWQVATDVTGTIHLSWVWRETPDVASNHDIAYACSKDGGKTWQTTDGRKYSLPITAATAEYVVKIPEKSELINQTSMFADAKGRPYIATYWKEKNQPVPQYHIVYFNGARWQNNNLAFRKTPFGLSGMGTKSIPVSRPQIVAWQAGNRSAAALIFRDEERGSKVSVAVTDDVSGRNWKIIDLTEQSVGSWEPTYDTELWKNRGILSLFVQCVTQVDGEGNAKTHPQPVQVIEWKPVKAK